MPTDSRLKFLSGLRQRVGHIHALPGSRSLWETDDFKARFYLRYSRVHGGSKSFFGLRDEDLAALRSYDSFVCFLWDNQMAPLLIPSEVMRDILEGALPATDNQFKIQLYVKGDGIELYVPRRGRINVEAFWGWEPLSRLQVTGTHSDPIEFTHAQVQSVLAHIGSTSKFDIWIPQRDRELLDWNLVSRFSLRSAIPQGYEKVLGIISEVDVIWIERGSNRLRVLYEVEHSTPIFSALLRFNDVYLTSPQLGAKFTVVANHERYSRFIRQLSRPTFATSGLAEVCGFLDYSSVSAWHSRIQRCAISGTDSRSSLDRGTSQ